MSSDITDPAAARHRWEPARVECYAGYRGDETPRAIILGGTRFAVAGIISRKRVRDATTGQTAEVFECRLEAGWTISLERSEGGSWRVRKNVFVPHVDLN
jgi:hypothetical protein